MNYTTKDNWHYKANEGYYFKKDEVIVKELYLGKGDSIDSWTVITEEEKVQFEKEIEERIAKEREEFEASREQTEE